MIDKTKQYIIRQRLPILVVLFAVKLRTNASRCFEREDPIPSRQPRKPGQPSPFSHPSAPSERRTDDKINLATVDEDHWSAILCHVTRYTGYDVIYIHASCAPGSDRPNLLTKRIIHVA